MQGNCQSQVLPATGFCRDLVLDSVVVDDCLLVDFQLRLLRTRCVRPSSVSHPTPQPPAHHSCSLSSIHPARHSEPLISPSACPCVLTILSVPLQKWCFSFTTYACAKFMSQYSPPQFSRHQCVRPSALSQAESVTSCSRHAQNQLPDVIVRHPLWQGMHPVDSSSLDHL